MNLKPEISEQTILKLIEDKKSRVGGGYLTDQGALFLVASDLSVALNYDRAISLRLSEVADGLQNLDVEARVLSFGPIKSFVRKSDSKLGFLSRLLLYDDSGVVNVNLWDTKARSLIDSSTKIKPGDLIKISNGYSRSGIDGSIIINIGERGTIAKVEEKKEENGVEGKTNISSIENRAVPPELILEPARFLVVRGRTKSLPRESSFTRSDGTGSSFVSFSLEKDDEKEMRVLIWENGNAVFRNLRSGELVTLLNVRSKLPSRAEKGFESDQIELHGDETTTVLEYWEETLHWMKQNSMLPKSQEKSQNSEVIPFVARLLSVGQKSSDGSLVRALLVDSQKRKFSTSFSKDSVNEITGLKIDDLFVCRTESIDFLTLRASCSKKGAVLKVGSTRPDIPDSTSLVKKIEDLNEDGVPVSLEVITLSESVTREVQTKDGLVRRADITLGDPTGEIKLFAWRELSKVLENLTAGIKMKFSAVEVQSHEGRKFLVLKNYSRVETM